MKLLKGIALTIATATLISGYSQLTEVYAEETTGQTIQEGGVFARMQRQLEHQEETDARLLQASHNMQYTFENPYVEVNPYGVSPLSAVAIFNTDKPMNISILIQSNKGNSKGDVSFNFDGYNTTHEIPIYGLYANTTNHVVLTGTLENGQTQTTTLEIKTDRLARVDSVNFLTDTKDPSAYADGFNFSANLQFAFDIDGDIRWYSDFDNFLKIDAQDGGDFRTRHSEFDYNGHVILSYGAYHKGWILIYESNLLGKIFNVYESPYGVHHNITKAVDGDNLFAGGSLGATAEDFIYEIDVKTGEIVDSLDMKTLLPRSRNQSTRLGSWSDWLHNNSVQYRDGDMLLSARSQSVVVNLDWDNKEIKWILGDHEGWINSMQQYLLTPIGDNFQWQYAQHAARFLPDQDGNPDTVDIILFDNGNNRFNPDGDMQRAIRNNEIVEPELYSRLVQYRINEKEMTVEQVWSFGEELGVTYYALWMGYNQLLNNGHFLGTFEVRTDIGTSASNTSHILEVNRDGDIVWEVNMSANSASGELNNYQVQRYPL